MTEHERLYQALDAITGGIADFLQAQRDDTWKASGWKDFNLTTLDDDSLLFGFRVLLNDERAPDPQISVHIDTGTQTASIRCVDTLTGYWRTPDLPAGCTTYAVELLGEMMRRREAGWITSIQQATHA